MRDSYRSILFAISLMVVLLMAGAAVVLVTDIFLILFLAMLFGVFLTKASGLLASRLPLPYGCWLAVVVLLLLVGVVGGLTMFGVQIEGQLTKVEDNVDRGMNELRRLSNRYPTLRSVLSSTPFVREAFDQGDIGSGFADAKDQERGADSENESADPAKSSRDGQGDASKENSREQDSQQEEDSQQQEDSQQKGKSKPAAAEMGVITTTAERGATIVANLFKTTFGLLVNSLLIFFVGLFLALDPAGYRDGFVSLFAPHRRERTREIMDHIGHTLWRWLIGRFATMLITGVGAGVLLTLCGTPMAATLGVITGLLTFIPNIGAFISLVLAVLFSIPQGGEIVLAVIGGYLVLQLIESYLVTPLIQQRQAELPPALLISCQAILGVLLGFLGAAVASPLLAAVKVGVEEAYIKDVLEAEQPRERENSG